MTRNAELAERRILVTGAGGSIGRAVVDLCLERGAHVVAVDLDATSLASMPLQPRLHTVAVDLTDEESLATLPWGARTGDRVVDGLVNAAGVLVAGSLSELSALDWARSLTVNAVGTALTIKHALPDLAASPERGAVVNLASVSAWSGSPAGSAYHASKGAVISLTYALAEELAALRVRVNAVAPGWVDGGFTDHARAVAEDPDVIDELAAHKHLLGRMASPREVAEVVTFLLSDRASFVTGSVYAVDGGFTVLH